MLKSFLIVGLGSFLGGGCRYLLTKLIQNPAATAFPTATLTVNTLGCLLFGLFCVLGERGNLPGSDIRLFLTVGLCGGFTTFSTFTNENFQLLRDGNALLFLIYTALSIGGGLAAFLIGYGLLFKG